LQEKNSNHPGRYEAYERDFNIVLKRRCSLAANDLADMKREQMMKNRGMIHDQEGKKRENKEEVE
jgi:hypothetical protein